MLMLPPQKEKTNVYSLNKTEVICEVLWCKKQLAQRQGGIPVINTKANVGLINNWATSKWHSGTPGEIKDCNSTSQRICSQRYGRNVTHTKSGSNDGNILACYPVQQVLSFLPLHQPSQTDGDQEKHRICAFCLPSSLCWKHKQQSTLHYPGMKPYPLQIGKI